MKAPASPSRVSVYCRSGELSSRIEHQLAREPRFDVVFAEPVPLDPAHADADLIVLDLGSLAPEGWEVYRVLQSRSAMTPILLLRARREPTGLAPGRWARADRIESLEARLHMALGRAAERRTWLPLAFEGVHLRTQDADAQVTVDGVRVELSRKELDLLGLLLSSVNRVLSRDVLISEIWGYETRSLDVYMRRLRRKLGAAGRQIETVTGLGYRFVEPPPGGGVSTHPGGRRAGHALQNVNSGVTRRSSPAHTLGTSGSTSEQQPPGPAFRCITQLEDMK
ncbi:MAG: response regulator transcription factor [Vicinamibacterales bacterium]